LSENDCRLRVQFCMDIRCIVAESRFLWECLFQWRIFHSNGSLNRHNSYYWSPVNFHWYREMLNQHRWNFCLGYVIIKLFICIFERTINDPIYLDLLQNHCQYILKTFHWMSARDFDFNRMLQHHYSQDVRIFLDEQYPNYWIGKEGERRICGLRDHWISIFLITWFYFMNTWKILYIKKHQSKLDRN